MLLLRPDLIVGISLSLTQASYKHFSQIAPIILLPWEETSGDWKLFLQDLAAVFDKTEKANQLINDYYRRVEELKQRLGNHPQQPYVSVIYLHEGIVTQGKPGFSMQILDDIGLRYPSSSMTDDKYNLPMSEENLPSIDRDILLIASQR